MSGINHERLVELYGRHLKLLSPRERKNYESGDLAGSGVGPGGEHMPAGDVAGLYSPAYWLGRIDEFAAQNAIEPEELVNAWREAHGVVRS
jgi:hypothetical protein